MSKSQQVSLSHLLEEFATFTTIVDFSYGLLIFNCRITDPVKVVNISEDGRVEMVALPGNVSGIKSITVSPGASFVFGDNGNEYYLWKRNTRAKHVIYKKYFSRKLCMDANNLRKIKFMFAELIGDEMRVKSSFHIHCYFSSDSKVAVVTATSNYNP